MGGLKETTGTQALHTWEMGASISYCPKPLWTLPGTFMGWVLDSLVASIHAGAETSYRPAWPLLLLLFCLQEMRGQCPVYLTQDLYEESYNALKKLLKEKLNTYLERQLLLVGGKPQSHQIFPPWTVHRGCQQIPLSYFEDLD